MRVPGRNETKTYGKGEAVRELEQKRTLPRKPFCGKVMALPQSGRLASGEQPQGLPEARAPRLCNVTVFIPAGDSELLL
jgi:hypothetical protein